MKPDPLLQDLDTTLRRGAHARRALLEQQAYPIGDYPPRRTIGHEPDRPNIVWRTAKALGLSVTITAGLLLALNWVSQFVAAPPPQAVAELPPAPALSDPFDDLAAQWNQAERLMNRQLDPTLTLATAWPGQVQAWSEKLGEPTTLPAPVGQEVSAIRDDLLVAADFVRRQWRASPGDGPGPQGRVAPDAPSTPTPA